MTAAESTSDVDFERSMVKLSAAARTSVDDVWRAEVKSLLNVNWNQRSVEIQHMFSEWVVDLATTNNFRTVLDGLFNVYSRALFPPPSETDGNNNGNNGSTLMDCSGQSDFLFNLIRDLCFRIPLTMQILPAIVLQNQPILRRPAHLHRSYCVSVLHLSVAAPSVRRQLVATVVSHLLSLDVRLPREVVISSSLARDQHPCQQQKPEVSEFISKLDQCMEAIFEFIERLPEISVTSNSTENAIDYICEFFVDVLAAFDAVVFLSKSASHINFILFYACARYHQLAAVLLDHLWARIIDEDNTVGSRRSALFYFASFLARGKFITKDQLRNSVTHLAEVAHFLRSKRVATPAVTSSTNKVAQDVASSPLLFDAAVEALIYIVAFHHATLCSGSLGFRFIRSLKLGELISCSSDPLSRCRESVVGMFLQVSERYHLALNDRFNRLSSCRTESMCSVASTPAENDPADSPVILAASAANTASFFPFDPYMLPHSCHRLRSLYAEFDASELLESSSESDVMISEDDDDDDMIGLEDEDERMT